MAAIAYVWNERKQAKAPVRNKVSPREAVGPAGGADGPVLIEGFGLKALGYCRLHRRLLVYSCIDPYNVTLFNHF